LNSLAGRAGQYRRRSLLVVQRAEIRAGCGDAAFNLLLGNPEKVACARGSKQRANQCALTIGPNAPHVKHFLRAAYAYPRLHLLDFLSPGSYRCTELRSIYTERSRSPSVSHRFKQDRLTTAVLNSAWLSMLGGGSMKVSRVHCRVRDLPAAARWFQQVLQATAVFNNERMAWLGFGEFGVILAAAPTDSALTLGFDSEDCDADYRKLTGRGAESIEAPQDKPWAHAPPTLKDPAA